jgi:hypothetical protein
MRTGRRLGVIVGGFDWLSTNMGMWFCWIIFYYVKIRYKIRYVRNNHHFNIIFKYQISFYINICYINTFIENILFWI